MLWLFLDSKGDKYVGEWKIDKKHGRGTLTKNNGDKYVGELVKSEMYWKFSLKTDSFQ